MRRITADSNILVSALQYGGKPLTLLDMAQDGRIELAISDDILTETLRVLRDKFRRPAEWLEQANGHLRAITKHVSPAERIDAVRADPDDNRVLECAVAADSQVIVSGDTDLLELGTFRSIPVMTVAAFLAGFEAQKP
ncbi:MAG: putative toxin-antitoxin system toxin component, PIN family [Acidobacteria bacterium]|nr:putative toxin-antitoxin system toxin component, PIN family [Acidobacteriota bacterium]